MTTIEPTEALVVVTPQQLDAIAAMIGSNNVHRVVVGENNIAAFWSDGPHIMEQIRDALPDVEKPRPKGWDELSPDSQETVVDIALAYKQHAEAPLTDWQPEEYTLFFALSRRPD